MWFNVKLHIDITEGSSVFRGIDVTPSRLFEIIGLGQLEAQKLKVTFSSVLFVKFCQERVGQRVCQGVLFGYGSGEVGKIRLRYIWDIVSYLI